MPAPLPGSRARPSPAPPAASPPPRRDRRGREALPGGPCDEHEVHLALHPVFVQPISLAQGAFQTVALDGGPETLRHGEADPRCALVGTLRTGFRTAEIVQNQVPVRNRATRPIDAVEVLRTREAAASAEHSRSSRISRKGASVPCRGGASTRRVRHACSYACGSHASSCASSCSADRSSSRSLASVRRRGAGTKRRSSKDEAVYVPPGRPSNRGRTSPPPRSVRPCASGNTQAGCGKWG